MSDKPGKFVDCYLKYLKDSDKKCKKTARRINKEYKKELKIKIKSVKLLYKILSIHDKTFADVKKERMNYLISISHLDKKSIKYDIQLTQYYDNLLNIIKEKF